MNIECKTTGQLTSSVYIDGILIGCGDNKDCQALCRELKRDAEKALLVKNLEVGSLGGRDKFSPQCHEKGNRMVAKL